MIKNLIFITLVFVGTITTAIDRKIFFDHFKRFPQVSTMLDTEYVWRDGKIFSMQMLNKNQLTPLIDMTRKMNLRPDQLKHFYIEEASGDFTPLQTVISPDQINTIRDQWHSESKTHLTVSNQTDQNARVWVTSDSKQSDLQVIPAGQDSTDINPPLDSTITIETLAGTYSIVVHPNNALHLFTPKNREMSGISPLRALKVMAIISPDGSVDLVERNI